MVRRIVFETDNDQDVSKVMEVIGRLVVEGTTKIIHEDVVENKQATRRTWTPDEDKVINDNWGKLTARDIATMLGRDVKVVHAHHQQMVNRQQEA